MPHEKRRPARGGAPIEKAGETRKQSTYPADVIAIRRRWARLLDDLLGVDWTRRPEPYSGTNGTDLDYAARDRAGVAA